MNTGANAARLEALTRQLMLQWEQTKNFWRDAKGREFEDKYIAELDSTVESAVAVIKQIDKVITTIRHDCE
jgi:hypothetical protein